MAKRLFLSLGENPSRKAVKTDLERLGYEVILLNPGQESGLKDMTPTDILVTHSVSATTDSTTIWCNENPSREALIEVVNSHSPIYLVTQAPSGENIHRAIQSIKPISNTSSRNTPTETSSSLLARVQHAEGQIEDLFRFQSKSPAYSTVNDTLQILRRESMRLDSPESNVLITGEIGCGHEGVARTIHVTSRRGKNPWVCARGTDFDPSLVAQARGGTLFVNAAEQLSATHQALLVDAMGTKDIRVIAATTSADTSALSPELSKKLSIQIELPSLAERKEDILPLARHFAEKVFAFAGREFKGFESGAEQALIQHAWTGNLYEMLSSLLSAVATVSARITTKDLRLGDSEATVGHSRLVGLTSPYQAPQETGTDGYVSLKKKWSDTFEREYLVGALQRHGGNVSAAAREAMVDRSNFLRLLRRHGLRAREYRKAA